jgi:ATP-dependent DNA ligase
VEYTKIKRMPNEEPTSFPEWVVPMAATLTQERFTGPEWIFERKLDGIRMLAFKNGSDVKLYSRNRLLQHYPAVGEAISKLPVRDVILDGEAAWDSTSRIGYHIFDILWLEGRSLMPLPLDARRALLKDFSFRPPLAHVTEITDNKPWERACSEGWEGVIAKRRTSPYEHRRSPHWLKMKCEATQELVVGGFTDPQGSRVGFGALLVGYFDRHERSECKPDRAQQSRDDRSECKPDRAQQSRDDRSECKPDAKRKRDSAQPQERALQSKDDFIFAGKIGTGFDTKLLLELRARLDKLEIPESPFTKAKGLPRIRVHWVSPEVVVQVAFIEWTAHSKLRHPRLLGVRYDKSPQEVIRETW